MEVKGKGDIENRRELMRNIEDREEDIELGKLCIDKVEERDTEELEMMLEVCDALEFEI